MNRSRLAVLVTFSIATNGCFYLGGGTFPVTTGNGIEQYGLTGAKLFSPEANAKIELRPYWATFTLAGLFIPIVPVSFSRGGLGGRLEILINLTGSTGDVIVQPDSLRVVLPEGEFRASSIRIFHTVRSDEPPGYKHLDPPPDQPLRADTGALIHYKLDSLPPPQGPYSILIDGLPRIDVTPTGRLFWGMVQAG